MLPATRTALLNDPALRGSERRAALTAATDAWLTELFATAAGAATPHGLSLVAVGSYGRRQPSPFSDLDLVLLHEPAERRGAAAIGEIADQIWYPVWDARLRLDHAVRTPADVAAVVKDDLRAQLGLLDLRHVAGDPDLSARTRTAVIDRWRASAPERIPTLAAEARARWAIAGEAAFLLEPDLKEARGGLRDVGLLRALALAQLVDLRAVVRTSEEQLLDVRGELQRVTGRPDDVARLQEHDAVARAVGLDDADAVLRLINEAARHVSAAMDDALRRTGGGGGGGGAAGAVIGGFRRLLGRPASGRVDRRPLARDVVAQDGEVVLARDAVPAADPALVLRAARAAAQNDLPLAPFTLERLAAESGPMPEPWPPSVYAELVTLLGTGRPAIAALEALDAAGLLEMMLPEWSAVRFRAQHSPVHRFTVDRHLLEAAAECAELTRAVDRPDLLLVGALLHDIGKGYPGRDHSIVGAEVARPMAERMGLPPADVEIVVALVRHHLLLPDTATRRDLDDPVTIRSVADVAGSRATLGMLHALAIADAAATGPGAWSTWKAGLIDDLVRRASSLLQGATLPAPAGLTDRLERLARRGETVVEIADGSDDNVAVDIVAPDRPGLLSLTAGVLALHSLDVHAATIRTVGSTAVNTFVVGARFGSLPDVSVLRGDLERASTGALALGERIQAKEQAYATTATSLPREPVIAWLDDAASDATVLEVRADDAIGLLYRMSAVLERHRLDVRSARVSSLGRSAVDVFYVTVAGHAVVPAAVRDAVAVDLRRVTASV